MAKQAVEIADDIRQLSFEQHWASWKILWRVSKAAMLLSKNLSRFTAAAANCGPGVTKN